MPSRPAPLAIGLALAVLYCLPYLLFGHDTPIRAHDNLDSNWIWYELASRNGTLLEWGGEIGSVMGGIPSASLGNDLFVPRILVGLVDIFPAYVINQVLIRAIGFVGMYRLLRLAPFGATSAGWLTVAVSVLWSWQPTWAPGGLSVLGLPLLGSAYLRMRRNRSTGTDHVVMLAIPFYSTFVLAGLFLIPFVLVDIGRDLVRRVGVRQRVLGVALFLATTAIVEAEVLLTFPGESQRSTFVEKPATGFAEVLDLRPYTTWTGPTDIAFAHVAFASLPLMVLIAVNGWRLAIRR